jgi:hypothetical protein
LGLSLALLIASSSATAEPDRAGSPNIPAPSPNSATGEPDPNLEAKSQLPLPYAPWRGTGPLPPTLQPPVDAPAPLARPRQLPRRPLELSAALSTFLPSCGSGSIDDRGCLTVSAGSGLELALLYRIGPFFALGGEAALSGFGGRGHGLLSRASGDARFFGVLGRVYFADDGVWDPYLALTLGAGSLSLRGDPASVGGESTTGFGARVAGGLDYLLGSHVRLGPAASFAHWLVWSEARCAGEICRSEPAAYGRLLGFATLGVRLTASFGDVL